MALNPNRALKTLLALVTLLVLLALSVSYAQTQTTLQVDGDTSVNVASATVVWEKTYGAEEDDRALNAIPTQDGFLIVGSSESIIPNKTVAWAIQLNKEGETIWNKTYLNGAGTELRHALNLTDGFLLVGNQFLENGDVNGYVAKIDDEGTLIWQTTIGGEKIDKLFSGAASSDGYAVFGLSYSYNNNQSAAWIVKLDAEGKVVWNKIYGGSVESALRSGVTAKDGGYVAAGYTDASGQANYDFYLLKAASDGTITWNKTYSETESQKVYSMTTATDGYVLVGENVSTQTSTDACVLKIDFDGNKLWEKTVGGSNSDSLAYVTLSKDGGFLVCGFTFSFGAGERDFWMFKISNSGQVQFSCTYGTAAFEEAYSIIETNDGAYVMVGWADPPGRPDLIGRALYNFYIVKLDVSNNTGTEIPWLLIYGLAILVVSVAIIILMAKLRRKGK